jgi:hypothetical protein
VAGPYVAATLYSCAPPFAATSLTNVPPEVGSTIAVAALWRPVAAAIRSVKIRGEIKIQIGEAPPARARRPVAVGTAAVGGAEESSAAAAP